MKLVIAVVAVVAVAALSMSNLLRDVTRTTLSSGEIGLGFRVLSKSIFCSLHRRYCGSIGCIICGFGLLASHLQGLTQHKNCGLFFPRKVLILRIGKECSRPSHVHRMPLCELEVADGHKLWESQHALTTIFSLRHDTG